MKKLIITITLMLTFSMVAMAAPKMELVEQEFNFGFAPQHAKISHLFWVKSVGDDTLRITKVIPGCGCTKAPLEKDVLAPGDSTRLEIIFSTKGYRNRVVKTPAIVTNEGPDKQRIKIITNIVSRPDSTYPIIVAPYKLDLSQFTEKVRDKIDFEIRNVSDSELKLSLIDFPVGLFSVSLPESVKPGEAVTASVFLNETKLTKSFEKSITIGVDDDSNSRYTIPVKRTVRTLSKK